MPKICKNDGCNTPVFSKGYCLRHQYIVNPPKPINRVSKSQEKKLKIYWEGRKEFLAANRKCQANLEDCEETSADLHHKGGRGKNLNEVSTWMALCRSCHDKIHNQMSMEEAVKRGLRIKIN